MVLIQVTSWDKVVLAYEPVWAIGTGKTASPQQVTIFSIHKLFTIFIIDYGIFPVLNF